MIPPPVLPSGHPLTHIRERFEMHSSSQFPEGLVGECPTAHPETGQFLAEVGADSLWRLSACDFGCSPEVIWESSGVDRQEPGAKDDEALPQTKKLRLQKQNARALLDEVIPPTEWLISPWLEEGSVALVVAPPNLGKTLLAFWFAVQVAASGKRVLLIEEEGSKRGLQSRVRRALAAVGGRGIENIDVVFKGRISLMAHADVLALCEECKGYSMIVIDSLARVMPGVEENDAKEMGFVVAALDLIREATHACSVSVHHTGKSKWKPGEIPNLGDGRGSGALQAGVDTVLALAPVADEELGVVQFDLHVMKQRDEEKVSPRRIRIQMRGASADVDVEVKDTIKEYDPNAKLKAQIIKVVSNNTGLSGNDICEMTRGNKTTQLGVIRDLFLSDAIAKNEAGRYVAQVVPGGSGTDQILPVPGGSPYAVGEPPEEPGTRKLQGSEKPEPTRRQRSFNETESDGDA